jgi:hypothetical protein
MRYYGFVERGYMTQLLERPNCPLCQRPEDEHFHVRMDEAESEAWVNNKLVCSLFRSEVREMIANG